MFGKQTKGRVWMLALVVLVLALAVLACGGTDLTPEPTALVEPTDTQEQTSIPKPTNTPNPTDTPEPTNPPEPTNTPEPESVNRTMYICGYDRCHDSGTYGELVLETGINVWSGHDPNRGMAHHQVAHGDEVTVISDVRVEAGPGGLWYELEGGGWLSDLWLTDEVCTPDNLEEYSFTACW